MALQGNSEDQRQRGGEYESRAGLFVETPLAAFIEQELLPDTVINADDFYSSLATLLQALGKKNAELLKARDGFNRRLISGIAKTGSQERILRQKLMNSFLREIGYITPAPDEVQVCTANVDPELKTIAGPQLVVPVKNARFALNAANARWGSLYNALYGTDAIPQKSETLTSGYDPERGQQVIDFGKGFLDESFPLEGSSHKDVKHYRVTEKGLEPELASGEIARLDNVHQFKGYKGDKNTPEAILLVNNGLHVEIQVDREHLIGRSDLAGVKDIVLESAITAIQDFEDSIAAVDGEDKAEVYRNMLGLYRGSLTAEFSKGGKKRVRSLNPDRTYLSLSGESFNLPGRSTLLIRNVGHLMTTPAVLDEQRQPVPEGILDALVTAVIAHYDLEKSSKDSIRNSRSGSVYIVKPKMQGPEEVAFCDELFSQAETLMKLPENTLKMGIMDEEQRTTLNLKACIAAASERVIFINTGFLDRTGSEIHMNMEAGPMVPKTAMKHERWIKAYEDWNVDTGLECGLSGQAQIGKGMWAMPDAMAAMLEAKSVHPEAGANCAWVPSPTAATLHAIHYHRINVADVQNRLKGRQTRFRDLLEVPVLKQPELLDETTIRQELENNAQGILGYVVRWIDQGVGCSKVPDIHDVNLMEDRATLRISAQHIANWLHYGICTREQVLVFSLAWLKWWMGRILKPKIMCLCVGISSTAQPLQQLWR